MSSFHVLERCVVVFVSISEASRLAKCSRGTIYKKIKSGELSSTDDGIDVAELERVFGRLRGVPSEQVGVSNVVQESVIKYVTDDKLVESLKEQVSFLRVQLEQERNNSERLLGVIEQQVRLLEHKPSSSEDQGYETNVPVVVAVVVIFLAILGWVTHYAGLWGL